MIVKELNSKKMYKEYSIEIPYKDVSDSIDNKIKTITIPSCFNRERIIKKQNTINK